nr:S1 family peptidase [Brevibacillus choshinensis]
MQETKKAFKLVSGVQYTWPSPTYDGNVKPMEEGRDSMATFREALRAKRQLLKKWRKMPGVVGIGVGYVNGKNKKGGACIVMYTVDASAKVAKHCPRSVTVNRHLSKANISVPVRTIVSGRCCCHPLVRPGAASGRYRRRIRPVIAGYSVGYPGISGTAGLIVSQAARRARRYLLSNNHVLNRNNTSGYTETIQPGGADGGRSGVSRIGRLYRFVRLRKNAVNYMDAAISIPTRSSLLAPRYATVGRVRGHVRGYAVGTRLKKVGRTTGRVSGTVESIHTDIEVDYGSLGGLGTIRFRNQTVIRGQTAVSLAGDSGSVWLTSGNYAAAVNFAGSEDGRLSISFPVQWAMQAFGLRVATATGKISRTLQTGRRGHLGYTQPLTPAQLRRVVTKKAAASRRTAKKRGR